MAGRCHEAQPEPFQVVEHVAERVNLELAAVAGSRVDLADGERAAQALARHALDLRGELGRGGIVARRRRLGDRSANEILEEQPAHPCS